MNENYAYRYLKRNLYSQCTAFTIILNKSRDIDWTPVLGLKMCALLPYLQNILTFPKYNPFVLQTQSVGGKISLEENTFLFLWKLTLFFTKQKIYTFEEIC